MNNFDPASAVDLSALKGDDKMKGTAKGVVGSWRAEPTVFELKPGMHIPVLRLELHEVGGRKIDTAIPPDMVVQLSAHMLGWLAQMEQMQQAMMEQQINNQGEQEQ